MRLWGHPFKMSLCFYIVFWDDLCVIGILSYHWHRIGIISELGKSNVEGVMEMEFGDLEKIVEAPLVAQEPPVKNMDVTPTQFLLSFSRFGQGLSAGAHDLFSALKLWLKAPSEINWDRFWKIETTWEGFKHVIFFNLLNPLSQSSYELRQRFPSTQQRFPSFNVARPEKKRRGWRCWKRNGGNRNVPCKEKDDVSKWQKLGQVWKRLTKIWYKHRHVGLLEG